MRYLKKPTLIEAVEWKGWNETEMREFGVRPIAVLFEGNMLVDLEHSGLISTLLPGQYVCKTEDGEFFHLSPEDLKEGYDPVGLNGSVGW